MCGLATLAASAALLGLLAPRPALAGPGPITIGRYVARLDRAAALARTGVGHPSPEAMAVVRAAAGLPADVRLGKRTVSVPADPLLAGLRGTRAEDFRTALLRIDALRRAGEQAQVAAAAARPVGEVSRALRDAYRGISYGQPSLGDRLRALARGTFLWLIGHLTAFRGAGSAAAWLVVAAFLAALGVFVWRIGLFSEVGAGMVGDRTLRLRAAEPVDWRRRAEEAMAGGDHRAAVRDLYRALVVSLARQGVLREVPGLTAGECRAAVTNTRPGLAGPVTVATAAFERVMYGHAPASAKDVSLLDEAERLARSA